MTDTSKAALTAVGVTLGGFVALGIFLAAFKSAYGALVFLAFEVAWAGYALVRLVRGLIWIRKPNRASRAKSDLVFFTCVAAVFVALYVLASTHYPR